MASKQQVIDTHEQHPDWTARQIADALGCIPQYVHKIKEIYLLKIPADPRAQGGRRRREQA